MNPVPKRAWLNLPNRITLARLAASILLFVLIANLPESPADAFGHGSWAVSLFVLVAATDWLDGYLARSRGEVTALGRILDPFVDKVAVCGSFVMMLGIPALETVLRPWMVVVIVAREFFVNDVRDYMESRGVSFGAAAPGKIKMLLQCLTVGTLLGQATFGTLGILPAVNLVLIWSTLVATVASGVFYLSRGSALLKAAEA